MTASAVITAASGDRGHRRLVQSAVIFLMLLASTAAGTVALTLLTNANEGFSSGFAARHGAQLAISVDTAHVTDAELAATRYVTGVTQIAGPYPTATAALKAPTDRTRGRSSRAPGQSVSTELSAPVTIVGRASPGGPLDRIALDVGHWPTRPDQIVLAVYRYHVLPPLGTQLIDTSAPGNPKLTVTGYAASTGRYGDAWVIPGRVRALRASRAPVTELMLYTFVHAGTTRQVRNDLMSIKAALPGGAITGYESWLSAAGQTSAEQGINTPFVIAFTVIGLVLAVLTAANIVHAAVLSDYRRIGVLKSLGFTPTQVAVVYLARIAAPAVVGSVVGTVLGNLWVGPLLIGGPATGVPTWINIVVPAGICLGVGSVCWLPAIRAGRRSAVAVIAAGQSPRATHGYRVHQLAGRLRLPAPVAIGVAAPFARPNRSAATLAAITFGATAVILAAGLNSSFGQVARVSELGYGDIQVVHASGGFLKKFSASQRQAITSALRAQSGTSQVVASTTVPTQGALSVSLPGTRPTAEIFGIQDLTVYAYDGNSAGLGWDMISGHWYTKPGEIVVNTTFLTQSGLSVGDNITITVNDTPITVRIVGQAFVPNTPYAFTSWQTLGGTGAGIAPTEYDVELEPGTNIQTYTTALGDALGPEFSVEGIGPSGGIFGLTKTSLIRVLTVLVAVLAGLGVLSSVLILTIERVRDLGIFKALGMTPAQTIEMVMCWSIAPAIAAAIIAIPLAILLHSITMTAVGNTVYTAIPSNIIDVYGAGQILLLALSGLGLAIAGALLPASWAAATNPVATIRAE